tara:strand:+ start:1951 stop:2400 length:450 start_codon:yes stop_codon:yes gene_type:complete
MSEGAAAGLSALGGFLGYKGNQAAARNAKAVAEYNAKVTENEAVLARRERALEEDRLRRESIRLAATQTTATAASGIEMSGSPLQALADTYFNTELDALRIQYAGDIDETRAEADAALTRAEGRARSSAFKTASYQSLLAGGEKAAGLM